MTRLPLDPDPLYVDDLPASAGYVAAFDAGYAACERAHTPLLHTTAFGIGVAVGMFLATVLILGAVVPRG